MGTTPLTDERWPAETEDAAQEERVIAAGVDAVGKAAAARAKPLPRSEHVAAFFRAQIEAAKRVQERVVPG